MNHISRSPSGQLNRSWSQHHSPKGSASGSRCVLAERRGTTPFCPNRIGGTHCRRLEGRACRGCSVSRIAAPHTVVGSPLAKVAETSNSRGSSGSRLSCGLDRSGRPEHLPRRSGSVAVLPCQAEHLDSESGMDAWRLEVPPALARRNLGEDQICRAPFQGPLVVSHLRRFQFIRPVRPVDPEGTTHVSSRRRSEPP